MGDDNPALEPFLAQAREREKLAGELSARLHGERRPSAKEAAALAPVLLAKGSYARAGSMFRAARPAGPRPSLERRRGGRRGRGGWGRRRSASNDPPEIRDAVSALARAGCAMGTDRDELDEAARATRRATALEWFTSDLESIERAVERSRSAFAVLEGWLYDVRLSCVRDEDALGRLPSTEAKAWRAAWARVTDLLGRTRR